MGDCEVKGVIVRSQLLLGKVENQSRVRWVIFLVLVTTVLFQLRGQVELMMVAWPIMFD
jgi:hypothetical protein